MVNQFFIEEYSNARKVRSLLFLLLLSFSLLFIGLFITLSYDKLESLPVVSSFFSHISQSITSADLSGMFYAHLLGGFFFVPSPDELMFYYGLVKGNVVWLALLVSLSGYLLAQAFNYVLGSKLSEPVLNLVSKKKVYDTRRFVNKYGSWGIFLFNLLPFPAPLLTLGLGITKYNVSRLFLLTIAGKVCKYLVIMLFFIVQQRLV